MIESKACPFCGEVMEIDIGGDTCRCVTPSCEIFDVEIDVERNTRPIEDALRLHLDQQRDALQSYILEIRALRHCLADVTDKEFLAREKLQRAIVFLNAIKDGSLPGAFAHISATMALADLNKETK